jgi:hypothetical protein
VLPPEPGFGAWLGSHGLIAKVSSLVVAVGVLGGGAFLALREASPRAPEVKAPAIAVAVSAERSAPLQSGATMSASPTASVEPEPARSAGRRQSDRLAQEVAILARATSELHAGHAANALKSLDEHRRKFPNGILAVERRAAHAQALCMLGRRDEAQRDLDRLAKSSSQSLNAARARQACDLNRP